MTSNRYTTLELELDDELQVMIEGITKDNGITLAHFISDVISLSMYQELKARYEKLEGLLPDILKALDIGLGGNDFSETDRDFIYGTLQKVKQVDEDLNHKAYKEGGF